MDQFAKNHRTFYPKIVIKIRDSGSGKKPIPDPGVKKAPDPLIDAERTVFLCTVSDSYVAFDEQNSEVALFFKSDYSRFLYTGKNRTLRYALLKFTEFIKI